MTCTVLTEPTDTTREDIEKRDPIDLAEDETTPQSVVLATAQSDATVRHHPVETIRPNRYQPRRRFDEAAMEQLKASLAAHGLLQPITVRVPSDGGGPELIAGERRLRAAVALGWPTIPAIERTDVDDAEALDLALIENIQRADLTPLEEADAFAQRLTLAGSAWTIEEVAARAGRSPGYVRARLQLTHLIEDAKAAMRAETLRLRPALLIARLTEDAQRDVLPWVTAHRPGLGVPTDGEVRQHIVYHYFLRLSTAPFDITDATLHPAYAARPTDATLVCANCPRRTGANPDLFGDVPDADLCTDHACFAAKRAAHVQRIIAAEVAQANERGETVLQLSDDYARADGGDTPKGDGVTAPLARSAFVQLYTDSKCDDTKRGVFVDGSLAGKVVDVCANASCPVHRASGLGGDFRKEAEARRQKAKRETQVLTRVLNQSLERMKVGSGGALPPSVFKLTLDHLVHTLALSPERLELLGRMLALNPPKNGQRRDWCSAVSRYAQSLSGADLARFLVRLVFVSDVVVNPYGSPKPERLLRLARLVGVDVDALRRKAVEATGTAKKATRRAVKG